VLVKAGFVAVGQTEIVGQPATWYLRDLAAG
jgi:hypothetical protein